ncbi:MAG TPA: GspE/PulE family protein [Phycisphaerae bacterium]|nr:GspE/PulE family protein [Phycisphaerae bacterium]
MSGSTETKAVRVGDVLVERGLITPKQVDEAIAVQQEGGKRQLLGEILIELGFVSQEQLTAALADASGIPFARLTSRLVDRDVFGVLPVEFVEQSQVVPLFKVDGTLTVAVSDLSNFFLVDEVTQHAGCPVQIVAALPDDIRGVIEDVSQDEAPSFDELFAQTESITGGDEGSSNRADVEDLGSDSPVVKLVNHAIHSAIREGASDIHFEPDEEVFRVRYRVDGQLFEKLRPPSQMQPAIVARIKIMAGMDISERRLPQDGAIRVASRGNQVDLRVSTLPNKYGEKVVIRIIDNSNSLLTFSGLRLEDETRKSMERICKEPYGIVLVTGPTGSGKSSTLYSMLNEINSPQINICTVEDPIEFNVLGINQFQVHSKIGLTFASVLRTLLRQDPDVIMLGEIRDAETATIAVQAALTGHLVLSTLHTNDSAGAITRLQNLGIEPYLISAALVGVVAQRLVRRVCPECKVESQPSTHVLNAAERAGMKIDKVAKGHGCLVCNQTGFKGRAGIFEILIPSDEMRDAIAAGANLGRLRSIAKSQGIRTLFENGMAKVNAGETTVEEVLRVTSA